MFEVAHAADVKNITTWTVVPNQNNIDGLVGGLLLGACRNSHVTQLLFLKQLFAGQFTTLLDTKPSHKTDCCPTLTFNPTRQQSNSFITHSATWSRFLDLAPVAQM